MNMMNNNNATMRSKQPASKAKWNCGLNNNQMMEYRSALSTFSDNSLSEIYNLMFNEKIEDVQTDRNREESITSTSTSTSTSNLNQTNHDTTDSNYSKLVALYNKCKDSSDTIAKIEATPEFTESLVHLQKGKRHGKMNNMYTTKQQPLSSTAMLALRSQLRRTNSSGSSGIQSERLGPNIKGKMINVGKNQPLVRKQSSGSSNSPSISNIYPSSSTNNANTSSNPSTLLNRQNPRNLGTAIPKSALNFLAALNAKKHPQSSKKNKKYSIRKKMSSANRDSSFESDDEGGSSSSSGVTDNEEVYEESMTTPLQENDVGSNNESNQNTSSNENRNSKRKRRKTTREHVSKNDDNDVVQNEIQNDEPEDRLRGRNDVIYDIGDEVAVYYSPEGKWYLATIQKVKFTKSTNKSKESSTKGKGSDDNDEKRVAFYTVEYDNGEVQDKIPPEDVIDKLDE